MMDTETAASATATMTAVHISDPSNGVGRPLSWSYTVSVAAVGCLAGSQKWIEMFQASVAGNYHSIVGRAVVIAIAGAKHAAAVSAMNGAASLTGQYVVGKHLRESESISQADEGRADAHMVLVSDGCTAPDGVDENGGAAPSVVRSSDGKRRSSLLLALVVSFYTVATGVALYSASGGSRDAIGYLASLFVFGSFGCRTMVPLRALALASNVAFMTYAVRNQLTPVLVLHALLLPTNIVRLGQIIAMRRPTLPRPHDKALANAGEELAAR
ncbi:MAG TPA: hypothetical protein VNQ56_02205 [Pseudolabrys sp.]|nr:hypothetical protein [Pseudolabrys sp.]